MKTRKLHQLLQIILSVLCGIFILVLVLEMSRSYELNAGNANNPEKSGTTENTDSRFHSVKAPPVSQYAGIIERPLFMTDRRPSIPEKEEEPETVQEGPVTETKPGPDNQYTLTAVIIDGDNRVALIKPAKENKTSSFNQGDMLDGWTISDIRKERVTLERGGQSRHLELKVAPSQGTAGLSEKQTDG